MSFPPELNPTSISTNNVRPYKTRADWYIIGYDSLTFTLNGLAVTPEYMSDSFAIFSGLTPLTEYTLVTTATNQYGSTVSTPLVFTTMDPLMPYDVSGSATETSLTASWLGGTDATSYTYTLNGIAATPSTDNSLTSKSVTFTGLSPSTEYTLIVTAIAGSNIQSSVYFGVIATLTPSPLRLLLKASGYTSGPWLDQSTSGNNAALSLGTPTKNAAGNGIVLDGQTTFTCADLILGNAWTVNVWYKHVGPLSGNYCILSQKYSDSQPLNMFIGVGPGSTNVAGGFLNNTWHAGGPITLPNEWTNIQITWDGTNMKTYILGSLTSSVQINYPSINNGMPYDIGRCDWGSPGFMEGELGEVRVYNIPLTQEEVTADFQESAAIFMNPLTPYNVSGSATANSFTATWLGGTGANSYTFTLNGTAVTPSVSSNSATFTGLSPSTNYTLIVTAVGSTTQSSSPTVITTLAPPPSLIHQFVMNGSARDFGTLPVLAAVSGSVLYTNYAGSDCVKVDSTNGGKINIPCVLSSTSAFTISFWLNMNTIGQWATHLSLNDGINGIIYFLSEYDLKLLAYSGNDIIGFAGQWTGTFDKTYFVNITATYSNGTFTIYINGSEYISYMYVNSFTSTQITIGGDPKYSRWGGFGGDGTTSYIRQLCIYDSALSTSDISALYTLTQGNTILNIPSDPLTPYGANISSLTVSSFTVNWLGGTGATSYEYTLNGIPVTPTQGQNSASVSGLESSTEYIFVIRAINSSNAQSLTTRITTLLEPLLISISEITQTSFKASWTGADRATSYEYRLNGLAVSPVTIGKTAIFNVDPGTYELIVIAENSAGPTESTPVSITTLPPPPTINIIGSVNVRPTFTYIDYVIENYTSIAFTLNGNDYIPESINPNYVYLENLTPGTEYTVVITATQTREGGDISTVSTVVFTSMDLLSPYDLEFVSNTTTSMTIKWKGGIGATSYSYAFKNRTFLPTVINGPNSATFTGLPAVDDTESYYDITVTAINSTKSIESAVFTTNTLGLVTQPTISVVEITPYSFDFIFYSANYSSQTFTFNGVSATPILTSQGYYRFSGLTLLTEYTVGVTVMNDGSSATSDPYSITTLNLLAPYRAFVTQRDSSSVTVRWLGGIGPTSYQYYVRQIYNNQILEPQTIDNGLSNSAKFTGLLPGTGYEIFITSVILTDDMNDFFRSNSVYAYIPTTETTNLTTPIITISDITQSSFKASWTGYAIGYEYRLNGEFLPSTDTSLEKYEIFTNLSPSTTYTFILLPFDQNGHVFESQAVITTSAALPPSVPVVSVSEITQTSFRVSSTSAGATSYTYTLNGVLVNTTGNNAVFTGLTISTVYSLVVQAVNSSGTNSTTLSITTLAPTPLVPPSKPVVSISNITQTSFKASWTGTGATSYTYTLNDLPITPIVNVISEKYSIFSGLSTSTPYSLVVMAVNADGSTAADAVTITTLAPPLANVLLLKAIDYRRGVWQDQSSSANNARLEIGTATKNAAGNGIVLNGSTSWTFPNLELGNSWTAAVWYKQTQAVNGACILSQKGVNMNVSIVDNSNGQLIAGFYNGAWQTGQPLTLNGWTNIQATWNGTTLKSYVNGTLTDSSQLSASVDSTLAYSIGSRDGITFAKGEIGEVRIYNYPLTQEQVTADYIASINTFATPVPGLPPTAITDLASNTVTGGSFGVSWKGGFGATSYTYTLNGSPATPSFDKALTAQRAVFTTLEASTPYTLVVKAVNENGEPSASISVTTLSPPAPLTIAAVAAVQETFTVVTSPAAAASAIEEALAANVAPQALVAAALAVATPAMFTALVASPAFVGTTVSVPPAAAAALYAAFAPTVTVDTTLPLEVNFPSADGSVKPPASGSNSKLAIDLNRDTFVPFFGCTGYGIEVVDGVQRFVTPTNSGTIVNVGDPITFTLDSGATVTFVVADLDIVFAPYTAPPTVVICFLGSAPVLTPSGYRRIDRLSVGDIVKTPTGTALVELIKKEAYTPGPATNPYVIPEGKFGANRKLHISPRHKVLVNGEMIEARHLGLIQDEHKNPIIYYNIQITKAANMIVAGVEVESLQPLVRVTISREAFNYMLATQHGGHMSPEIKARCHFLPDGRVSVPSIRT